MLFQLGTVTFDVAPVNIDGFDQEGIADFAAKDVMGALRPREFMGEGETAIGLKGTLWPEKFGGLSTAEEIDKMRVAGTAQILMRGDGTNLGWFLIDRFSRRHSFIDASGIGRKIDFDISLVRSPAPQASTYLSQLVRLVRSIAG